MTTTGEELYDEPVRFKVEVWDPTETGNPLYTFDPFGDINAQPFILQRVSFRESGPNTPGSWEFGIKTTKRFPFNIKNIPSGAVVRISGGKTADTMENFIVGVLDRRNFNVARQFHTIDILYSGLGIGHINSHSLISYRKQPDKSAIDTIDSILNDPNFRIDNMAADVITNDKIFPIANLPTIKDRAKYDDSELTGFVRETLGALDYTGTVAGIFEIFAQSSGSALIVDGARKIKLRYPNSEHSGHIIRPWLGPDISNADDGDYTLYYMPPLAWGDSIAYDDGCVQAVKVIISDQGLSSTSGKAVADNFYMLAEQDICWQVSPLTTNLQELALVMSKLGTGHSDIETALGLDGVIGYITTDNLPISGASEPSKSIIAEIKIPYESISETPRTVTDIKITWKVTNVDVDRLYWIVLLSSGIDSDNTIKVHTDGDSTTDTTDELSRRVGIKSPPTGKNAPRTNKFWKNFAVTTKGPTPLYSFFSTTPQSIYAADSLAQSMYTPNRPREIQISAPFIRDIRSGFQFANAYLSYASKKKVMFNDAILTIPNKLVHPLNMVDLILPEYDYPENNPLRIEVVGTAYEATIDNISSPLGAEVVRVSGVGYINHTDNVFLDNEEPGEIC